MSNDAMKRARELADAWQEQKRLSDEQQSINTHFDRATPHQLIKMWDTGLNVAGKKLSAFELGALIERWCKVFGALPPDDAEATALGTRTCRHLAQAKRAVDRQIEALMFRAPPKGKRVRTSGRWLGVAAVIAVLLAIAIDQAEQWFALS